MKDIPKDRRTDAIVHSRAYLTVNIFEALIAVLGIISGISWVVSPAAFQNSAIHDAFGNWAYLWLGPYVLSGVLILSGLIRLNPRLEASGLILFGTGTVINGIAFITAFGLTAAVSLATLAAAALTCFVRAYALTQKRIVVLVEEE